MKPGRRPVSPAAPSSFNPLVILASLPSFVACALAMVVALFPDERVVRLKLMGLETGLFALTVLVGIRLLLKTTRDRIAALIALAAVPAVFAAIQWALWFLTPEKSLATVEIRRVLLTAASFAVFALIGFSDQWRRRFLWTWAVSASFVALYGVFQKTGGVGMLLVPLMERPIGTFGNPIFFAAYLLVSLFVTMHCFARSEKTGPRALAMLLLGVLAVALYLTQTRAAWIGLGAAFAIGIGAAMPRRKERALLWLLLLLLAGAGAIVTRATWSRDQAHQLIWRDTVSMWLSKPLVGVGLGTFHIHFPDYAQADLKEKWPAGVAIVNDAHNEYLQQLAEGGVIGFASWMLLPVFFLFLVLRNPTLRQENAWLIAGVVGVATQNLFSVDMRFGVSASLVAQLMGLVAGSYGVIVPGRRGDRPGSARASRLDSGVRHPQTGAVPRWILSAVWTVALVGVALPRLWQPYRANKQVQQTPDFFDQRLLTPTQTISDLETLAQQYPNEPAVLEKLAYVYAKEIQSVEGKLNPAMAQGALSTYEKVLAIDPSRAAVYNNMGNIQYTIGHVDEALVLWRTAFEKNPQFIDARLNLGKILYTKGQLKEAAIQFDAVLRENPGNAEATVYLKRMVE